MFRHVAMLLTKQHPHLHKEITDASAFVLFQLSASNYDTLIGSINQIFASTASSSEEDTISQLNLIEHLNLKRERLMDLLSKINRAAPSIKKAGVQLALARVLRKAIWNWIDQYPMEFVQLCRAGVKLSRTCLRLRPSITTCALPFFLPPLHRCLFVACFDSRTRLVV